MANTGTSAPAVARRRVSLALRRAREAKKWTQTQVATAMEWSLSKVMRIEKGQVNISPTDLRAVLQILEVTDEAEIEELLADARVSRNERYIVDDYDRERLTPAMIQLFQYELEATSIRYYNNVTVPGLLQTSRYARVALSRDMGDYDEATIQARLESRLRRRAKVFDRNPSPDYRAILDESVLLRNTGGPDVMADQLDELVRVVDRTSVRVRVAPFRLETPIVYLGPFIVLDFKGEDNAVLYREVPGSDEIVTSAAEVEKHRSVFDRLWPNVLNDAESRQLIKEAAQRHRSG